MIDDTVIEKPYAKNIECVYWQYSSKNGDFIQGILLTVLLWSDGKQNIPIKFMIYEKEEKWKHIKTKNEFAIESLKYVKVKEVCMKIKNIFNKKLLFSFISWLWCFYK